FANGEGSFLLSDTVGFIRKLPPELVAAFRATLEEAANADLLLLVLDSADKEPTSTLEIVLETLRSLNADTLPRIVVLNKIDKSGEAADFVAAEIRARGERVVPVCALDGRGFAELLKEIKKTFDGADELFTKTDIL
ncbi:MAG: GTPase HflX, partial [Synergistes sp.]|nr:GTPase HflX [Synergistes sp.]